MIGLKSFQVKNCFGFGDSGEVNFDNTHNMFYILGRNSSGKTSLLTAIKYFEHNLTPHDYPNYVNFRPTQERPRMIAKFSLGDGDLSTEDLLRRMRKRFEGNVPESILEADERISRLFAETERLYEKLVTDIVQRGYLYVEKSGNGVYRFLTSLKDEEDYEARRNTINGLLSSTFQSPGQYVDINQTNTFPVNLDVDVIEGFLFLQFPRIFLFEEYYSLSASLPKRITHDLLHGDKNAVQEAFISYLNPDTIKQLLNSQDPEERDSILQQLQGKVDSLCGKVNRHGNSLAGNRDLIAIRLHENFGLQITVRTDGKNSFYDQISDSTKLLLAYHVHHESSPIRGDILLFDEPNTGFHPTAQEFVLNFLRSLGDEGNMVVLSTHSEYMIDPDLLSGVRIMTTDEDRRLTVRNKFTQATKGRGDYLALQPILDAIGLRYGNLINVRDRVVITEGITDMLYLRAFKKLLHQDGRLDFAPARGDSHILSLIPLFIAQGISLKIVVDTGPVTRAIREDYNVGEEYLYEIPIPKEYESKMEGSGIEDLFSKNDFKTLLEHVGLPVEEEFNHVSNSFYVRGKPAKGLLAHLLYEKAETLAIEFDQGTRSNFDAVLRFCANDKWWTI